MIFQDYTFANISFLWALAIIPFLAAWLFWRPQEKQSVLRTSSLEGLESPTFWTRIYPLLWVLRLSAIALLIVALARPRTANVSSRTKTTKGIDIVMAIDISSSMLSRDLRPNRLTALKRSCPNFCVRSNQRPNWAGCVCWRVVYQNTNYE